MRGLLSSILLLALLASGCAKSKETAPAPTAHAAEAKPQPPHGGTGVPLGDDYSMEFVLDPIRGTLEAYVLDDDMENFIRVQAKSFDLRLEAGGSTQVLTLTAGADSATGESVGNTSYFRATSPWLQAHPLFKATLIHVTIRGSDFDQVTFAFPR
jgi:hypothetical protein